MNADFSSKLKLHVIVASTRPQRVGEAVGRWFYEFAAAHGVFETRWIDLAEINLPVLDEPAHPRLQKYEHDHTKAWARIVDEADAYIIVTPEYNYGMPPSLLNAFDYVYREWNYKPVGYVSYGGASGGMRSVQMSKMIATTLKMMPMVEAVAISHVNNHLKEDRFVADDYHEKTGRVLLDELHRWAVALKPMRG